ncbi:MAG: CRISPR-associated endonuclease Cas2 [Vulcanimicrobiota bacterium]
MVVTYDICDPKRLRLVFETMKAYGEHVQLSVFRCQLDDLLKTRMVRELTEIVNHDMDQVLIFDLGPSKNLAARVEWVGVPYEPPRRGPTLL